MNGNGQSDTTNVFALYGPDSGTWDRSAEFGRHSIETLSQMLWPYPYPHMTAVQGIMQRGGEVRTFVVPNTEGPTLRPNVIRNVEWGAKVYTDATPSYYGLARRFAHSTVDHVREYVRGDVHTNSIENVWSLFKRCIKGTWTHIAAFHVHRYADEQAWRFNHRKCGDGARFAMIMQCVVGKRLTYRHLCAIGDAGFMGLQ